MNTRTTKKRPVGACNVLDSRSHQQIRTGFVVLACSYSFYVRVNIKVNITLQHVCQGEHHLLAVSVRQYIGSGANTICGAGVTVEWEPPKNGSQSPKTLYHNSMGNYVNCEQQTSLPTG